MVCQAEGRVLPDVGALTALNRSVGTKAVASSCQTIRDWEMTPGVAWAIFLPVRFGSRIMPPVRGGFRSTNWCSSISSGRHPLAYLRLLAIAMQSVRVWRAVTFDIGRGQWTIERDWQGGPWMLNFRILCSDHCAGTGLVAGGALQHHLARPTRAGGYPGVLSSSYAGGTASPGWSSSGCTGRCRRRSGLLPRQSACSAPYTGWCSVRFMTIDPMRGRWVLGTGVFPFFRRRGAERDRRRRIASRFSNTGQGDAPGFCRRD